MRFSKALVCSVFGIVVCALLWPRVADAQQRLDATNKKRVERIHAVLARIQLDESLRKNVPPSKHAQVVSAKNSVENKVWSARAELKKIPKRLHGHPEVAAAAKAFAPFDAYVADLDAVLAEHAKVEAKKEAARAAGMAKLREFIGEYRKYQQTVDWFKVFYDDPKAVSRYGDRTLAEGKEAFAAIRKGCTGKYEQVADPSLEWNKDYRYWCEMALRGDEILRSAVRNWVTGHVQEIAESFAKQEENLASCNGRLVDWDEGYYLDPGKTKKELLARYEPDAEFVGIELAADLFAPADAALARLVPKIEEASKGWKFTPSGQRSNDAFVRRTYQKGWPGVKVLKVFYIDKGWRLYRNYAGVNQYRTRRGRVLFKIKGEPWCREQQFTTVQTAKGRRGFGKSHFEHSVKDGRSRIISCK